MKAPDFGGMVGDRGAGLGRNSSGDIDDGAEIAELDLRVRHRWTKMDGMIERPEQQLCFGTQRREQQLQKRDAGWEDRSGAA